MKRVDWKNLYNYYRLLHGSIIGMLTAFFIENATVHGIANRFLKIEKSFYQVYLNDYASLEHNGYLPPTEFPFDIKFGRPNIFARHKFICIAFLVLSGFSIYNVATYGSNASFLSIIGTFLILFIFAGIAVALIKKVLRKGTDIVIRQKISSLKSMGNVYWQEREIARVGIDAKTMSAQQAKSVLRNTVLVQTIEQELRAKGVIE